ncbi:MAG: Gfo/Idh/MocA family oxidoreductase [Oscillospiraceae bacterium]|nr:Gfo/Idh/MocA family oxidoreductase [Oscillospiraceae bacterium]
MKRIKTVIVGMGKMGRIRYDAMKRHGGYDIVSVCDIDRNSLNGHSEPTHTDWRKCLALSDAETVVVCTYNGDVTEIVCHALNEGMHVFAEKPPGRNLGETKIMKDAHSGSGLVLKFGFNHRYHNSIIEAKTLIEHKLLGDLVCARGVYGKAGTPEFDKEWRNDPQISGGGILLDQGIHMIDLLCYFCGSFSQVHGSVDQLVWQGMKTEDSVFAILKTDDGKIASLHSSAIQWKHKFDLDLICTNGGISLNGLLTASRSYGEERITYYRKDLKQSTGKLGNPIEHTLCFDEDNSWDYEMSEFFEAVANGAPIENGTIDDALGVMGLIEKVYSA